MAKGQGGKTEKQSFTQSCSSSRNLRDNWSHEDGKMNFIASQKHNRKENYHWHFPLILLLCGSAQMLCLVKRILFFPDNCWECMNAVAKDKNSKKTSLTQEDLLLSHRVGATHNQCVRVECDGLEGCVSSKSDHFLLWRKCIFWTAVSVQKKKA